MSDEDAKVHRVQAIPAMSMSSLPLIRSVSGAASTILFLTAMMYPGCTMAMHRTRSTGSDDHALREWLLEGDFIPPQGEHVEEL